MFIPMSIAPLLFGKPIAILINSQCDSPVGTSMIESIVSAPVNPSFRLGIRWDNAMPVTIRYKYWFWLIRNAIHRGWQAIGSSSDTIRISIRMLWQPMQLPTIPFSLVHYALTASIMQSTVPGDHHGECDWSEQCYWIGLGECSWSEQ